MHKPSLSLFYLLAPVVFSACQPSSKYPADTGFNKQPREMPMRGVITEASGLADSRRNPGYLWVNEDSGNPPQLFLLSHDGQLAKTIYITAVRNRDWEEVALAAGPDPAKHYVYIAETGDNLGRHDSSAFYRLEEPSIATDTIREVTRIPFVYEDGPRDAEAFLVDDASKDIYIISKRDDSSRIYRIGYPYVVQGKNIARFVEKLPYRGVVSACINPEGTDIIVKTYRELYHYTRRAGQNIPQALANPFTTLPYVLEPQGEAVCWALDGSGYYTLSEKGPADYQSLFFYSKK